MRIVAATDWEEYLEPTQATSWFWDVPSAGLYICSNSGALLTDTTRFHFKVQLAPFEL